MWNIYDFVNTSWSVTCHNVLTPRHMHPLSQFLTPSWLESKLTAKITEMHGNWADFEPLQLCSNFDTEYVFFFFFCICLKIISVENWQHICLERPQKKFKTSYTKYANFREIKSDMRRFLMAGYELSNLYNGLVFYQINGIVDCIFKIILNLLKKSVDFQTGYKSLKCAKISYKTKC